MRMEMAFGLRQEQTMRLAPQIIQSIEILQLPLLALEERLQTELVENPVLEMVDKLDESAPPETKQEPDPLEGLGEEWGDHFSQWSSRSVRRVERDRKLDAMQNTSARGASLQDHLLAQLTLLDITPRQRTFCENIVCNVDANGYLQYPLEEILPTIELPDATLPEAEAALRVVQTLEPPGVGARDLTECLLLQLDPEDPHYVLKAELIQNHLEDIRANRFPQIAKDTGRSLDEIKKAIEFVITLTPKPGALFDVTESPYIMPDVLIEDTDAGFEVKLQESTLPRLIISPFYRRLLASNDNNPETKEYIRKKIQSARWLIDSIEQRRNTLLRVSQALVEAQGEFLRKGAAFLRPLRMQEVARKVGIHVSTVSRAISGKYMQTPQGIFEMRYFFTGGTTAVEGGAITSWQSIRDRIGRLIETEDHSNPLSDEEIARQLIGKGMDVSRRTVTKYRKTLGIPSSRQRRQY